MKLSSEYIKHALDQYKSAENFFIAFSGGVDSHVLLHLCASLSTIKHKLTAVHVHHGLQPDADDWAEHCSKTALQLGVKFILECVDGKPKPGESPEEAARNARYQVLSSLLGHNDILLTAQHREDQAETILLQLFRGSGLAGLSGMPVEAPIGIGFLVRPLLDVPWQSIKCYALDWDLEWVEDTSNLDIEFDRNYLRNQVMPLIKHRWPSIDKTIARSGRHCSEAMKYLDSASNDFFNEVFSDYDGALSIRKLLLHNSYVRKMIIRRWFETLNLRMPSEQHVDRILNEVISARSDSNPVFQYSGYMVRRYRDKLYLLNNLLAINTDAIVPWDDDLEPLSLENNGTLEIINIRSAGIPSKIWKKSRVTVRYRQGGERIPLYGREGRHTPKKLFQDAGVPPWIRERMPLIYFDDQLAAIGDLWVSSDFFHAGAGDNLKLQWCFTDSLRKDHDETGNVD